MQVIYKIETHTEHVTARGAKVTTRDLQAGVVECPSTIRIVLTIGERVAEALFYVDARGRLIQ